MKNFKLMIFAVWFVDLNFLILSFLAAFYVALHATIFWAMGFLLFVLFLKELLIPAYLEI